MPYKDKNKQSAYQLERQHRIRAAWFRIHGKCVRCGSKENLELDHIDPSKKITHRVWSWAPERRKAELVKCQSLCKICHKKKTSQDKKLLDINAHLRIKAPNGMAWCNGQNDGHFAPISEFGKNKSKRNGLSNECKKCRRQLRHSRRQRRPPPNLEVDKT
jgi:hypothetical protein